MGALSVMYSVDPDGASVGLIASVSRGGQEEDIALIQNLATSYIERSRCIILLTVACESGALRLAPCCIY